MADKTLIKVRETALAYAEAVRTTQRFFDRIEDTDDPSVLAEYATLVEREKEAVEARLDALEEAGIEVPSIDESDPDA
jgi:predicted transcriptional regulator